MNGERLYELSNCEVCKKEKATKNINIGLNIGYQIGDYAEKKSYFYEVEPKTMAICSVYVCDYCKTQLKNVSYYWVDILPKIKEEIKSSWVKQKILESLK